MGENSVFIVYSGREQNNGVTIRLCAQRSVGIQSQGETGDAGRRGWCHYGSLSFWKGTWDLGLKFNRSRDTGIHSNRRESREYRFRCRLVR